MSFTDQKPRYATEDDLNGNWGGGPPGKYFRCYLCGHKFKLGDYWRWIYCNDKSPSWGNFVVCEKCDGPDVKERRKEQIKEAEQRFWWLRRQPSRDYF